MPFHSIIYLLCYIALFQYEINCPHSQEIRQKFPKQPKLNAHPVSRLGVCATCVRFMFPFVISLDALYDFVRWIHSI